MDGFFNQQWPHCTPFFSKIKRLRIAVSGTHFIGKSSLIEDFIKAHSDYKCEIEPYYKLQDEKTMELSLEPSLE